MLMKHTQVSRDGTVTEPVSAYKHPWTRTDRQPLAQLTYGALLSGRTSMVGDSANTAKRALTIATRYAAVRRQFSSGKGKVRRSRARLSSADKPGRDTDSGLPYSSATINGEMAL